MRGDAPKRVECEHLLFSLAKISYHNLLSKGK